jgi:hypothetical protein
MKGPLHFFGSAGFTAINIVLYGIGDRVILAQRGWCVTPHLLRFRHKSSPCLVFTPRQMDPLEPFASGCVCKKRHWEPIRIGYLTSITT